MGEKTKNVICSPSDAIEGLKRQIFELISLKQTTCGNLPNLEIPNVLPGVPDLNPSQAVIDFLNDLLAVISGINWYLINQKPVTKNHFGKHIWFSKF